MRNEGLTISSIEKAFDGWQAPTADIMTVNFSADGAAEVGVQFAKMDGEGEVL